METMPFGKYRGVALAEVPDKALAYYLAWDQLREGTRKVLAAEWARRHQGELPPEPDPVPAAGARVTPEGVRNRAFDIVTYGLETLERQHKSRPEILQQARQAAELLRGYLRTSRETEARDAEVPF